MSAGQPPPPSSEMSCRFDSDAYAFHQDIGGWNTAAVTNMYCMFDSAYAFFHSTKLLCIHDMYVCIQHIIYMY